MLQSYKSLALDSVQYDPKNPRVAQALEDYPNPTDDEIGWALQGGDQKFIQLKQAIRTARKIIHPIIVNQIANDHYIVIEGNTRLSIYRAFHKEDPNEECWSKIPAVVHKDMDGKAIDSVRLNAHLVGVRPWTPYDKGRYLALLYNEDKLTLEELKDFCGGNRHDVARNIEAFNQVENTYRRLQPDEDFEGKGVFSQFLEVQQTKIKGAVVDAGFTDEDFAKWVIDGKFKGSQRLVRKLPEILSNPEAKEVFLRKDAKSAREHLRIPGIDEMLQKASLVELCAALSDKLERTNLRELETIRGQSGTIAELNEAKAWIVQILGELEE